MRDYLNRDKVGNSTATIMKRAYTKNCAATVAKISYLTNHIITCTLIGFNRVLFF